MRLIDADALDKETRVKNLSSTFPDWYDLSIAEKSALIKLNRIFTDIVREAPTIDAVPVVRCKDCKFAEIFENESYCLCLRKMAGKIRPDDFCSYGERKDGE